MIILFSSFFLSFNVLFKLFFFYFSFYYLSASDNIYDYLSLLVILYYLGLVYLNKLKK